MLISSSALQTSPPLINESAYQSSMTWLQSLHHKFNGILTEDHTGDLSKDTNISLVFGLPSSSKNSSSSSSSSNNNNNNNEEKEKERGEMYEGIIYDVAEDALENPYQVNFT